MVAVPLNPVVHVINPEPAPMAPAPDGNTEYSIVPLVTVDLYVVVVVPPLS